MSSLSIFPGQGQYEQAAPARFSVGGDAGLERQMIVTHIHAVEHFPSGEGFVPVEVLECAVGIVWPQRLEFQYLFDDERLNMSIPVY